MSTGLTRPDAGWASTAKHWYISIRVNYDAQCPYGRSLGWLAPELRGAGLVLIEDHLADSRPWRTWAGAVDAATLERFADAWVLPNDTDGPRSDPVSLRGRTFVLDGMNWEAHGESPIVCVSVRFEPMHDSARGEP